PTALALDDVAPERDLTDDRRAPRRQRTTTLRDVVRQRRVERSGTRLLRVRVAGAPPESEAPGLAAGHERNPDRPDARAVEAAQPRDAVLPLDCPHPPGDERLAVGGGGRK